MRKVNEKVKMAARDMPWESLLKNILMHENAFDVLQKIVSDFMAGNPANNADRTMRIELEDIYNSWNKY